DTNGHWFPFNALKRAGHSDINPRGMQTGGRDLLQAHFAHVVEADFEAFEGVQVAVVAFDEEPFRPCGFAGFDDVGPVEVTSAHFTHFLFLRGGDFYILEVDAGNAAGEFADPCCRIAAT